MEVAVTVVVVHSWFTNERVDAHSLIRATAVSLDLNSLLRSSFALAFHLYHSEVSHLASKRV